MPKRRPYVIGSGAGIDKLHDARFGFREEYAQQIDLIDLFKTKADVFYDLGPWEVIVIVNFPRLKSEISHQNRVGSPVKLVLGFYAVEVGVVPRVSQNVLPELFSLLPRNYAVEEAIEPIPNQV